MTANNLKLKAIGLPSSLNDRLASQSIFTVQDFFGLNYVELLRKTGLTYQKLSFINDAITNHVAPPATPVCQLKLPSFVLFQDELDDMLQGGIQCGQITEFSGAPGLGKTQLCLQLAFSCTLLNKFSGVLYIDSEGSFSASRMLDIANSKFKMNESQEKLHDCLNRVHLWRPNSFKDVLDKLISTEVFIIKNRIGLLIIDSSSLVRRDFGVEKSIERGDQMCSLSSRLKQLAHAYDLAVVVTNHVTAQVDHSSSETSSTTSLIPALGPSWSHWINSRIHLTIHQNKRRLVISKSAEIPEVYVDYLITVKGLEINRSY